MALLAANKFYDQTTTAAQVALRYSCSIVYEVYHCSNIKAKDDDNGLTGLVLHCILFMVALWNRADHIYFHAVICSFFFFLFFIPRLISAAADWMSAILPHMVWP